MIGVCCRVGERDAVREFFELFKTPWEFHAAGRTYDVVISTLPELPAPGTRLTVVCSPEPSEIDAVAGVTVERPCARRMVLYGDERIPIYGPLARLNGAGRPVLLCAASDGVAGMLLPDGGGLVLRTGYNLFGEVAFLVSEGQPAENAAIPALDLHIGVLREQILAAGIPLVEIPPVPWGHTFAACLTHDIDFAGVRQHRLDHTSLGFVYRATLGSLRRFLKGGYPAERLAANWKAALSLPLVWLGLADDFWAHFDRYAALDRGRSTFFLVPFKGRPGDVAPADAAASAAPSRRATRYDVGDVPEQVASIRDAGSEVALHGIDAWHSAARGREERDRIAEAAGQDPIGVRMHWLYFDRESPARLEAAGFDYDATLGYNDAVGYRAGTGQVFQPRGTTRLLELPLHIQDTSLFYPGRLGLSEDQAWDACAPLLDAAARSGGVLTLSWHERSLAPERLWGDFYRRLLAEAESRGAWFGSAGDVVAWFRARRSITFEDSTVLGDTLRLQLKHAGGAFEPCMTIRVHAPGGGSEPEAGHTYADFPYAGESRIDVPLRLLGVA